MEPNRKETPDGKVSMVAGIMVLCFEIINVALMVIRHNVMLGQMLASGFIMALCVYYIYTGKQKMDVWKKEHGEK